MAHDAECPYCRSHIKTWQQKPTFSLFCLSRTDKSRHAPKSDRSNLICLTLYPGIRFSLSTQIDFRYRAHVTEPNGPLGLAIKTFNRGVVNDRAIVVSDLLAPGRGWSGTRLRLSLSFHLWCRDPVKPYMYVYSSYGKKIQVIIIYTQTTTILKRLIHYINYVPLFSDATTLSAVLKRKK